MAKMRWLEPAQEQAWRRYRRMRTLLDLQIARDLKKDSGLSEPDYDVLSTLSESPDGSWRAREFAARLLWSSSRLAHQVGRMEQRGLVVGGRGPGGPPPPPHTRSAPGGRGQTKGPPNVGAPAAPSSR